MRYFKFICIFIALVAVDLIAKFLFYDMGIFSQLLPPTFNTGISFWISVYPRLVKSITVLFLIIISYLTFNKKINPWVGIFLIAGCVGNFIDRLWLGGVRDFIRLGFGAVFNIADVYITIGVILALWKEYQNYRLDQQKT